MSKKSYGSDKLFFQSCLYSRPTSNQNFGALRQTRMQGNTFTRNKLCLES